MATGKAGRPKSAAEYKRRINERLKECSKCHKTKKVSDFYSNKAWKNELYKDAWCKNCVKDYVIDKKSLMEYCGFNNRIFNELLWESGLDKANDLVIDSIDYKNAKDDLTKDYMIYEKAIKHYLQTMSIIGVSPQISDDDKNNTLELVEPDGNEFTPPDDSKTYSKKWSGYFTSNELNYLESYFEGLQRDFKLENTAYLDYAKKVCKASLALDNAFSEMMNCKASQRKEVEARYQNLQKVFDNLSQSAKFAEKTRTENDAVGLGNLGDIIKRLETTGFLQTKITFEKDEVDAILDDYRWILTSIGEDI